MNSFEYNITRKESVIVSVSDAVNDFSFNVERKEEKHKLRRRNTCNASIEKYVW